MLLPLRKTITMATVALTLGAFSLDATQLDVVSYTPNRDPASNYGDPNRSKLTDGVIVENSNSSGVLGPAVGWIQNPIDPESPNPAIVFDLGELKYVDEVAINYVLWPSAGVRAPNEVRISYSMDGEEFLLEETFTGFDGTESSEGWTIFTRNLATDTGGKAARYVRLDFRQGPGEGSGPNRSTWTMLDEVTFHGRDIEDVTVPGSLDIYQAVELEFDTEVGVVYQIQASDDLINWENFGSPILGNGQPYWLFTSTRTKERGFFRVRTNE